MDIDCCDDIVYAVYGFIKYSVSVNGVPGCNITLVKLLIMMYCIH